MPHSVKRRSISAAVVSEGSHVYLPHYCAPNIRSFEWQQFKAAVPLESARGGNQMWPVWVQSGDVQHQHSRTQHDSHPSAYSVCLYLLPHPIRGPAPIGGTGAPHWPIYIYSWV